MKLVLCFSLLLLATCSSMMEYTSPEEFLSKHTPQNLGDTNNLSIFIESIWAHFGLDKPDQITRCFDDCSAKLFWKELCTIRQTIEDSRDRKSWSAHLDWIKLELINKSLQSTFACVMMTQDFTDLLDALKIDERNPEFFDMVLYLYYQAFYPRLSDDIQPLVDTLKAKDFTQAGDIFGGLLEGMIKEIKSDGFSYLALAAFLNGANSELNIDFPSDSLKCHTNDSAHTIMTFLWKLSYAVSNGDERDGLLNTIKFWKEEGSKIIDQLPDDVVQCHLNSTDVDKLSDRLKIRVGSPAFREALIKFINRKRLTYFVTMKQIRSSFEDHNFVHGGYTWGHFLDRLSGSLPYHEQPKTEQVAV